MPNPFQLQRVIYPVVPGSSGRSLSLPAGATARWNVKDSTGADGDLLAAMNDLIGSRHGSASGSNRPTLKTGVNGLNGHPVARFDGVANFFTLASSITLPADWTVVAVMKRTGTNVVSLGNTGDFLPAFGRDASSVLIGDGKGGASGYATASNAGTGWQVVSGVWSGNAALRGALNGGTLSFGSTSVYGGGNPLNTIGRRLYVYSSGDLADLIYWPLALSDAELIQAHDCLNAELGGVY